LTHCPSCGNNMIIVAQGTISKKDDERIINQLSETNEQLKRTLDASKVIGWGEKEISTSYEACVTCKKLYMIFGIRGYYMDILGQFTDDFIAHVVTTTLKGNE